MGKRKFSWDLFTDENENIVMKDTKDNEMIFLQMAEEQGIEVGWHDFNYSNDNCHCYYSFTFGNKICMSECKCHTDDEIYSLQEVIEGLNSNDIILEDGDIVQLRNGAICVIIDGFLLDFNEKEVVTQVKEYDSNLKDISEVYLFDIVKVAKKGKFKVFSYIDPHNNVSWTWEREKGIPDFLPIGTKIKAYDRAKEVLVGIISELDIGVKTIKLLLVPDENGDVAKCEMLDKLDLLEVLGE